MSNTDFQTKFLITYFFCEHCNHQSRNKSCYSWKL